jgi:Amt family ammonium transporter
MNKMTIFRRVDDALGVVHTHGFAGLIGGLMVGLVADPGMIVYPGTGKTASFSVGGLFYGSGWHQFLVQLEAAAFVVACSGMGTFAILKLIGLVVPLRMPEAETEAGDLAIHGEEVGVPTPAPVPQPDLGTALAGSTVVEP